MKLHKLEVENFRCFDNITLDLHPELTVLIAPNGAGKTALLDAARIALWPYVKAFDLGSQTGKSATIQIGDVRRVPSDAGGMHPRLPSKICATGTWPNSEKAECWTQTRERIKSGTNTLSDARTKRLTERGKEMQRFARVQGDQTSLPMVVYMGTGRLWFEGRFTSVAKDVVLERGGEARLGGYLNCLTVSSSFRQFSEWFANAFRIYREAQAIAAENGATFDRDAHPLTAPIRAVQVAVDCLLKKATGWSNIAYSVKHQKQLVLTHPEHGTLPLEALSDGLRNTVALVADLAFRACTLNPHLGENAVKETEGIALIDEVDMFLHPSWQQTILASLRKAFPKIQFIVTTHSPQVLSTVPRDNIRVIKNTIHGLVADQPLVSPLARKSGDALAYVMEVDAIPPMDDIIADVHAYEQLIRGNGADTAMARKLKTRLDKAGYEIPAAELALWQFLGAQTGEKNRG